MKVLIACEESQTVTKEMRSLGIEAYLAAMLGWRYHVVSQGGTVMDLENDALPLEYKLLNGRPTGDLQLSNLVHDPLGHGVVWVSCYGFKEKLSDFLLADPSR